MTEPAQAQQHACSGPGREAGRNGSVLPGMLAHRLFQVSPGFACILRGSQHVFEFANEGYYRLVGERDLIGKPVRVAFPYPELEEHIRTLDRVYQTRVPYVGRAVSLLLRRAPEAAPEECFLDLSYLPITAEDGSTVGILAQGYEVTELVRTQAALQSSEQRLQKALEAAGEGVWDWNIADDRFSFSERGRAMLGYQMNEVGARLDDWVAITHPDDSQRVREEAMACVRGKTPILVQEYRVRNKKGEWQWICSRGAVVERSPEGRALRMMGTTTDISSEQDTLHRANFDTLTGLANRSLFRDQLAHEMALSRRSGQPLALFFIDLDHFKEVNDLLGHDAGDQLLCQAAARIRDCVRESDMAARLGGDEFTVILTSLDSSVHVGRIAHKILQSLAEPFQLGANEARISGSIGITLFPSDAVETGDLLRNADQAMYAAKQAGRDQFRFFTPAMQEEATRRIALQHELRQALPKQQLQVVFQPIVELASGRIAKAEALLRWLHPQRGVLVPADFMAQAEESGIISEIGNWVFTQAASWSRHWSEQTGATFQVSINRSPAEFNAHAPPPDWDARLRELGLGWQSISVDIRESLLLKPSPAVENRLLHLRRCGIQVAIDDFGSGYSSLACVKKYDVDFLKIDQSFVREAGRRDNARVIAETIIVMAHKLGLKVVAEGVESAEQQDWLRAAGCDYAQGYFFSEPVPPERFGELLREDARA